MWPEKIVAVDIETTGLNSTYDFITMFSAVIMTKDGIEGEPFYTRVSPDFDRFKISPSALAIQVGDIATEEGAKNVAEWLHGLMQAPPAGDVAKEFAKWSEANHANRYPVVAHKADFDMAFFKARIECFRSAFPVPPLSPVWIDTLALAKIKRYGKRGYTLDDCLLREGLEGRSIHHDALQDAMKAGELYFALTTKEDK